MAGSVVFVFFFKQKTAYEIKECDWSSDVCSSDLPGGTGESVEALVGAVCGFCDLAEEMAGGRRTGERVGVLEGAVGRDTGGDGIAAGPAAAGAADVCGGGLLCEFVSGAGGGVEAVEPGEPGDVVHDAADGVRGIAVAIQRAGGHSGGIADRQPAGGAAGGVDRVLREHAGDADAGEAGDEPAGVAGRGEANGAGGIPASGCAVRAIGGGAVAAAESEPDAAVPGDVCVAERADGIATAEGAGSGAGRKWRAACAFRPGGACDRARGRNWVVLAVQQGSV